MRRAGILSKRSQENIDGMPADHPLDGGELKFDFPEKAGMDTVLVVPALTGLMSARALSAVRCRSPANCHFGPCNLVG